jgi:hypothetical protein
MNERRNEKEHRFAAKFGHLAAIVAIVSALLFSVSSSWTQAKVVTMLVLCTFSIPLLEYGNSDKWYPAFAYPKGVLSAMGRILAAVAGLSLLLSIAGFCLAFGPGNWKLTMAGLLFGMYSTSLLLIRYGITGRWFL